MGNREIKFRAWDKLEKQMLAPMPLEDGSYHCGIIIEHNGSRAVDEYEFMQYTGLLDKNGKEIFEDDLIIMNVYDVPVDYPKTVMNILYEGVVKFYHPWNAFVLEVHHKSIWGGERAKQGFPINLFSEYRHTIEKVGTIYENPELLK